MILWAHWDFPPICRAMDSQGVPAIFIEQYPSAGYTNIGTDPTAITGWARTQDNLSATFDKVHGPHDIKFGFDGRIHQINYIQTNAPNGFFSFNADGSYACPYGNRERAAAIPWPVS